MRNYKAQPLVHMFTIYMCVPCLVSLQPWCVGSSVFTWSGHACGIASSCMMQSPQCRLWHVDGRCVCGPSDQVDPLRTGTDHVAYIVASADRRCIWSIEAIGLVRDTSRSKVGSLQAQVDAYVSLPLCPCCSGSGGTCANSIEKTPRNMCGLGPRVCAWTQVCSDMPTTRVDMPLACVERSNMLLVCTHMQERACTLTPCPGLDGHTLVEPTGKASLL